MFYRSDSCLAQTVWYSGCRTLKKNNPRSAVCHPIMQWVITCKWTDVWLMLSHKCNYLIGYFLYLSHIIILQQHNGYRASRAFRYKAFPKCTTIKSLFTGVTLYCCMGLSGKGQCLLRVCIHKGKNMQNVQKQCIQIWCLHTVIFLLQESSAEFNKSMYSMCTCKCTKNVHKFCAILLHRSLSARIQSVLGAGCHLW